MKNLGLSLLALSISCHCFAGFDAQKSPVDIYVSPEVLASITDPVQKTALEDLIAAAHKSLSLVTSVKIPAPQTRFDISAVGEIVDMSKLFLAPDANSDLVALSQNPDGSRRLLTPEQLNQVHENGYFIVPSKKYPGQNYVWKLSAFFQVGAKNISIYVSQKNASALRDITIVIPQVTLGSYESSLSLRAGLANIVGALRESLSLVVGLTEVRPKYSDSEIATMIAAAKDQNQKEQLNGLSGKPELRNDLGFTPDLRLFEEALMKDANVILSKLSSDFSNKWGSQWDPNYKPREDSLPNFAQGVRRNIRSKLLSQGVPLAEVEMKMEGLFRDAKNKAFLKAIANDSALNKLSAGLGQLISDHTLALGLIAAGEARIAKEVSENRQQIVDQLIADHAVRGRIPEWVAEKADAMANEYYQSILASRYGQIETAMLQAGLKQEAFLFRKNLEFARSQEKTLSAQARSEMVAANKYVFSFPIYRPENWVISKTERSGSTYYTADRTTQIEVNSASIVWRLQNLLFGSLSTADHTFYKLMVANLWNGPVGVKSLFGGPPFPSRPKVNSETGKIEYTSETGTLASRLRSLNESLNDERARFEARTTHGIFGKDMSRLLLQVKHFGIRLIGGGGLSVLQPTATAANAVVSTAVAGTSPVWSPVLNLVLMGFNAGVLDLYSPDQRTARGFRRFKNFFSDLSPITNQILFRGVLGGVGQSLASVVAIPAVAASAGVKWAWGNSRAQLFKLNDAVMGAVMKGRAGIPGSNVPGIVTLTAGPGLAKDYYFQISPSIAQVAVWARLEQLALQEYQKSVRTFIETPEVRYDEFVRVFGEFIGLKGGDGHQSVRSQLTDARNANLNSANKVFTPYERLYEKLLKVPERASIRMTESDLLETRREVAALVRTFVETLQKDWSTSEANQFWFSRNLQPGDYDGMAQTLLADVFSESILEPLERIDSTFKLRVESPELSRMADSFLDGRTTVSGTDQVSIERQRSRQPSSGLLCSAIFAK